MTTVSCPTCKRAVEWGAASPWRPFCSERCKLIDLGEWASERNVIAGENISSESVAEEYGADALDSEADSQAPRNRH